MTCEFKAVGTTAKGWTIYRCQRAGCRNRVASPYGPERIHTRCKAAAEGLATRIADRFALGLAEAPEEIALARLAVCEACEEFAGDRCRRLCKGCPGTHSGKFVQMLTDLETGCEKWAG